MTRWQEPQSQKPLCSHLGCVSVHYLKIDTCTTKLLTVCKPLSSVVTVEAYSKKTRRFIGATCRICPDFLFLHNVVQFSGQLKTVCLSARWPPLTTTRSQGDCICRLIGGSLLYSVTVCQSEIYLNVIKYLLSNL